MIFIITAGLLDLEIEMVEKNTIIGRILLIFLDTIYRSRDHFLYDVIFSIITGIDIDATSTIVGRGSIWHLISRSSRQQHKTDNEDTDRTQ